MVETIVRSVLGLVFVYFGLNGFFNWQPLPPMKPRMMKFGADLQALGIVMPVVKVFEIIFGALLLANQFVFVATLALGPICFFIVLAHFTFNRPKGFIMSGVIGALYLAVLAGQWANVVHLFEL